MPTHKCPRCKIGLDIDMVEIKDPVVSDYFFAGFRVCPNCDIEITVHKTGNISREYIGEEHGTIPETG